MSSKAIQLRAKIIGLHLRDARLASGKSMKELGDVIGISSGTISAIERGANSPSLPELELLAFYLGTAINHFWSEQVVSQEPHLSDQIDTKSLMALRHRAIAAMLRQARSERNLSQKDLADRTGISSSRIRRYESGETPVPLPELELLADCLGYDVDQFADNSGPVGEWIQKQRAEAKFDSLPRGLKEFVVDPDNRAYLEIAQKLKSISIDKLRALTESIGELLS